MDSKRLRRTSVFVSECLIYFSHFDFGSLEIEGECLVGYIPERIRSLQDERTSMHAKEVGYNNELQQTQQKLVALEKVGDTRFGGCVLLRAVILKTP